MPAALKSPQKLWVKNVDSEKSLNDLLFELHLSSSKVKAVQLIDSGGVAIFQTRFTSAPFVPTCSIRFTFFVGARLSYSSIEAAFFYDLSNIDG